MTDVDIQSDLNREAQEVKRYLKARMEWDDRYGSARTQALNWRYLAFLLAGLLVLTFLGLIYLGTLPKQAIHIVETDKLGQAVYRGLVGVDADHYQIPDASKQYHLRRFIDNVRSLPADTVVVKQQWEDAYALLSPAAANVLSDYARKDPPTERMQNQRVTLGNITLIPISADSWSAEWQETTWNKRGGNQGTRKWKGIFNLIQQMPTTEAQLRINPIGMYIDSFSWATVE